MRLDDYLLRIGFDGDPAADLPTLQGVLRSHALSVPFENLDVQWGRPVTTSIEDAFVKIVGDRRGGWCYEQNGLFGWALSEMGFEVTRLAAAVMRQERGEVATANHLCLSVRIPGSPTAYLADVGFGGSLVEPIELEEGDHAQPPYRLGLQQLEGGFWRFWEDHGEGPFSFDFQAEAGDERALQGKCELLQTDPSSQFVQNCVVQRRLPDRHRSLRGRVLTTLAAGGEESRVLDSAEEFVTVLATEFGLDLPEAADLWPRILARHEQLFGSESRQVSPS